jgi:Ca2+/Na+ antiporter
MKTTRKTIGLVIAIVCYLVHAVGSAHVLHGQWRYDDFAWAGVFLGLAIRAADRSRFFLGLFLCTVSAAFGLWDIRNRWLLLSLWLVSTVVFLIWLHWKDARARQEPGHRNPISDHPF